MGSVCSFEDPITKELRSREEAQAAHRRTHVKTRDEFLAEMDNKIDELTKIAQRANDNDAARIITENLKFRAKS